MNSDRAETSAFAQIRQEMIDDPANTQMRELGYEPVYAAGPRAKIVVVGQAPGIRAQLSGVPWDDASGANLRDWMGISADQFYDPGLVALLPMDFFFPGKGAHGDLPPRKGFADTWHPRLLGLMPEVKLTLLVGAYAQKHYLGKRAKQNLTETVRAYNEYLPAYLPLVHPSPLNFRWQAKNPWFVSEVVPDLRDNVARVLSSSGR